MEECPGMEKEEQSPRILRFSDSQMVNRPGEYPGPLLQMAIENQTPIVQNRPSASAAGIQQKRVAASLTHCPCWVWRSPERCKTHPSRESVAFRLAVVAKQKGVRSSIRMSCGATPTWEL
ncbi:hypothetical protein GLAREA_07169 [Glarea lozoyensis ATCC 20868]|uniref:Uncharacterized protein n=1 Tax=Glarea lozoyensis (strain ATCC 20868 / MF5171) TaxID=1116229 RepID=S3DQ18_GLAL2|nr:uncharacterized protein GLAREA_07169 [Glarea lozoyensis ATCC 20868]EPE34156.1 hypothetical protein GLAREA_07169 [Glarea lozoyensis ATCC 20868]